MPEPTLYLVDGHNLLHAGAFTDRDALVDLLAGHLALRGARGVVVFDGVGANRSVGPLEIRFAEHADDLLEQLAAERRTKERVLLVSSDRAIRDTAGQDVAHRSSSAFAAELRTAQSEARTVPRVGKTKIEDALDEDTRSRLERWRRRRA
jgi:predicted RNA-binding protein with PIN domain